MGAAEVIVPGVYLVGGPNISRAEDATVFVIDGGEELVMIDAGAGRSARILESNILDAGLDPRKISLLILTHCHIDHIGAREVPRFDLGQHRDLNKQVERTEHDHEWRWSRLPGPLQPCHTAR